MKVFLASGASVAEITPHSRMITGLACHPSKSVFATCGDDSFVNVFEISGDKTEKVDVNLIVSSRVNDMMMTGICFGGEGNNSILGVPYDYKNLVVWNNVV